MSEVKFSWDYSRKKRQFYINSPAGQLTVKVKNMAELQDIRNQFCNQLSAIKQSKDFGGEVDWTFLFDVYRAVMKKYRTSYKANIRTRMRGWISRV